MIRGTCRDECIMLLELLKKLKGHEKFEKTLFDIKIHIDRQKGKIDSDLRDLYNRIDDKKFDIECYDYVLSEIEKMKSEVQE